MSNQPVWSVMANVLACHQLTPSCMSKLHVIASCLIAAMPVKHSSSVADSVCLSRQQMGMAHPLTSEPTLLGGLVQGLV